MSVKEKSFESTLSRKFQLRGRKSSTITNAAANQSARSSLALAGLREFEGRALNHQGTIPKCTTNYKNDTNSYQTMRGHINLYERVPKYTTVSFGMCELCPRMKSDSEANPISRPERREGRYDTAVLLMRIGLLRGSSVSGLCFG
jgi:hypothetical protein